MPIFMKIEPDIRKLETRIALPKYRTTRFENSFIKTSQSE